MFLHVWDWFWSLAARRGSSQSGASPISHTEFLAWNTNLGIDVRGEEIKMLVAMDDAYLSASAKEQEATMARKQK